MRLPPLGLLTSVLLLTGCQIIDPVPVQDFSAEATAKILIEEQSRHDQQSRSPYNFPDGIPLKLNQTYRFKVPTHTWWSSQDTLITLGSWTVSPLHSKDKPTYPEGATFKLTRLRRDGTVYQARVSINNSTTDYELGVDFIGFSLMLNARLIEEVKDSPTR